VHCPAGYLHCDVIKASTMQLEFVYFFFIVQPFLVTWIWALVSSIQLRALTLITILTWVQKQLWSVSVLFNEESMLKSRLKFQTDLKMTSLHSVLCQIGRIKKNYSSINLLGSSESQERNLGMKLSLIYSVVNDQLFLILCLAQKIMT